MYWESDIVFEDDKYVFVRTGEEDEDKTELLKRLYERHGPSNINMDSTQSKFIAGLRMPPSGPAFYLPTEANVSYMSIDIGRIGDMLWDEEKSDYSVLLIDDGMVDYSYIG